MNTYQVVQSLELLVCIFCLERYLVGLKLP